MNETSDETSSKTPEQIQNQNLFNIATSLVNIEIQLKRIADILNDQAPPRTMRDRIVPPTLR